MRFLILSDLHTDREEFKVPTENDTGHYDAVILAGDIREPGRKAVLWAAHAFPNDVPVLLTPGNHESHHALLGDELKVMRQLAEGTNVRILQHDEMLFEHAGERPLRVLGCTLWTDFEVPVPTLPKRPGERMRMVRNPGLAMAYAHRSIPDYRRIGVEDPRRGTRLAEPEDILDQHRADRAWLEGKLLEDFSGTTVVVTHHGPSALSADKRFPRDQLNPSFYSDLGAPFFGTKSSPALWAHGHLHSSKDYQKGSTRVISNPRGYMTHVGWENPAFNPALVIEV